MAVNLSGMDFKQWPDFACIGCLGTAWIDSKLHPCPVVIKIVATMHQACQATKLAIHPKPSSEQLMADLA